MPLPASWTRITVTATYLNMDGTPATGSVLFRPTAEKSSIASTIVLPSPITAQLDVNGSISVQLPATTDPDLQVTGWHYKVVERVPGGGEYYIEVPHDGGPINLANVLPLFTPTEMSSVLSAPAVLAAQQAAGQAAQSVQDAQGIADSMTGALAGAVASATSAAAGSANAAANSATAAAGSATAAANSATTASNSATAAGTSATAAGNSAAAAAQSAIDAQIAAGTHVNDIGVAGQQGFGVGTCPALPAGFTEMDGTRSKAAANYGNYTYSDGSVMVWIPKFYYRIGHASSPRYAVHGANAIDILPAPAFIDVAAANAAGYALHRMFYDAGAVQPGVFVDKYQCSNNGGVASSIRMRAPLSVNPVNNPISALSGAPANAISGVFAAAKTRGSTFFPAMRYIRMGIALLAQAHAQASTSTTYNAWWSSGATNFPKGNNNNALGDANDPGVVFASAGYSNVALTGSGTPFHRTTHNGQASGVADLNGNLFEATPGLTAIATSKTISGASNGNPVQVTAPGHGFTTGDAVMITNVGGMTELNSRIFLVTVTGLDTFTLNGVNGTAFAAYTGGGTATKAIFYALSTAATAASITGGQTLATDQWGAVGVAAHSEALTIPWRTDYPNNNFSLRWGDGANQVLSSALSGDGWGRTCYGLGQASASGTTAFGSDLYYRWFVDMLCPCSGGNWSLGQASGMWATQFQYGRNNGSDFIGFRAARYLS